MKPKIIWSKLTPTWKDLKNQCHPHLDQRSGSIKDKDIDWNFVKLFSLWYPGIMLYT